MFQGGLAPILIVILAAVVIGGVGIFIYQQRSSPVVPPSDKTACTLEAMICPDGTAVGRSGPQCEFALCPTPKESTDSADTLNWKTYATNDLTFNYPSNYLVKESRSKFYEVYQNKNPIDPRTSIGIDATLTFNNSNYEKAVDSKLKYLSDRVVETIPNGIKIIYKQKEGYGAGIMHYLAFLKYGTGAIRIEAANPDQATVEVFNKIITTFEFTR